MALSLATVGGKVTAALYNAVVNWVNPMGSSIVFPTTVNVGSGSFALSAAGRVTFSGASSVSVNGCFTAAYDNYRVVVNITGSSTSLNTVLKLRASGTDVVTGYDQQNVSGVGATAAAAQTLNAASWQATSTLTGGALFRVELFAPFLAQQTLGLCESFTFTNPMTSTSSGVSRYMLQEASTSCDGFTVTASTGNITGNIRVYAWNNG